MTIHKCPESGSGITPCCGVSPGELPHTDLLTLDDALADCSKEISTMTKHDYLLRQLDRGDDEVMTKAARLIREYEH